MKELLEKFFGLFSEGLEKLEENKTEEAIKKLTEASELSADLSKKSEEKNEVDLEKFFESEKGKQTLKKYADLYISASTLEELMTQLKEANQKIDELKKEKEADDETVTKTLESLIDRVEAVEKTAVSKIED